LSLVAFIQVYYGSVDCIAVYLCLFWFSSVYMNLFGCRFI